MDRNKYFDKSLALLNSEQFVKLNQDPTATTDKTINEFYEKFKQELLKEVYPNLYPTRSLPGKFYRIEKIYKLSPNQGIDELPLRPIIPNINPGSYELACYLAKVLLPLSRWIIQFK